MTPHAAIEGMAKAAADHGGLRGLEQFAEVGIWADVLRSLKAAVHFDLSDACPTLEHEDFAFDLFKSDLFTLPFPNTFWTLHAAPRTGILVCADAPASFRPTGALASCERGPGIIIIEPMLDRSGIPNREWLVPTICGQMSYSPLDSTGLVAVSYRSLIDPINRAVESRDEDSSGNVLDIACRLVCGATVMLMTPDVEVRVDKAPEKLNAQRAKKGRAPIGERRTIIVRPHARLALTGNDAGKDFEGRRMATPHMRRGHFRTLHRDTDAHRVIPVAPCVVGITDEARAAVSPKQYIVRTP